MGRSGLVAGCLVWIAAAWAQAAPPLPQQAPPAVVPLRIAPGEAQIDDGLEITGDSIAGKQIDTRMAVGVTVDGHGPYRFVVDSGADRSVIGARLAQGLALPAATPVMMHDVAGASRRDTVLIKRLGIGSGLVEDIAAPTLPEPMLGAQGLIGIDALHGQRLMLDFESNAITVEDSRRALPGRPDDIVVTARRRAGQLILTQARASGVGIRAVVDTGSQLTIGNLALRDALVRRHRPPMALTSTTLIRVTGMRMTVPLALVAEMRVGSIVLRNVVVGFADLPPFALFGLGDTPAMLLGTDLMSSFRRVSLDFASRKVRFQLRRCPAGTAATGACPPPPASR